MSVLAIVTAVHGVVTVASHVVQHTIAAHEDKPCICHRSKLTHPTERHGLMQLLSLWLVDMTYLCLDQVVMGMAAAAALNRATAALLPQACCTILL